MKDILEKNILFFDGSCAFCTKSVQIFIKHNSKNIYFSSLQGQAANLVQIPEFAKNSNSLVFYSNHAFHIRGQALRKLANFTKPFSLLRFLLVLTRILPLPLVNAVYTKIAQNRHKINFKENCAFDSRLSHKLLP